MDKTAWLGRLVDEGKHYFLSRPRRFGKSLLLDTLKELFEGNEALFKGLAIHDRWDWSVRHPVLRLSFGSGSFKDPGFLGRSALAQLETIARKAGLPARYEDASLRFGDLIESLHEQTGRRVVVLVDEYDKPILDALESPEIARANRDFLRGLYGTIKDSDAHVRFTLLTGVSRFSRVSLFSGLNNLKDITLDPRHGAICGYTEADLGTVFAPELAGLDRVAIREWYNGYHWRGEERVYNPFDILLLFDSQEFGAYWFETGTPTFLVETLAGRGVNTFSLDGALASDALLSSFDVDAIAPEALLFQTGYLTIRSAEWCDGEMAYQLGYPNREVRLSLNRRANFLSGKGVMRACSAAHWEESFVVCESVWASWGGRRRLGRQPRTDRRPAITTKKWSWPEPEPAGPLDGVFSAVGGTPCRAVPRVAGERLRRTGGVAAGTVRGHSLRVAHEQDDREVRGVLRERGVLVLCGVGNECNGGGQLGGGAAGHGGSVQRQCLSVRAQGAGAIVGGGGDGAASREGLRGEVPGDGREGLSHRCGVQRGNTHRDGFRSGARGNAWCSEERLTPDEEVDEAFPVNDARWPHLRLQSHRTAQSQSGGTSQVRSAPS